LDEDRCRLKSITAIFLGVGIGASVLAANLIGGLTTFSGIATVAVARI
jgi:hypothetical protein